MQFTDAVTVAGTRRTEDGYLIAEARAVRTGIQLYAGDEVGRPDLPVVRVYRSPEEVFAADSLRSFTHAPITLDHPKEQVTAETWKDLAVGEVSTMAKKDGEWVLLPLILKDAKGIAEVEGGKRQLSAGYTCELDWTPGTTADGHAFDAQQKNIKINHLAIVDAARAGSQARIGDGAGKWGASPVTPPAEERSGHMADNLRKVLVDGLQVETTDAGAQAISKLQKDLQDSAAKIASLQSDHAAALAAKDAEIAKKDAEIDALKGKILDQAAIDKLVADRAALVTVAGKIAKDVKTEGLSDADIRKAVVVAKLGDAAVKDKPQAYIDARFDILAEEVAKTADADPFRRVVAEGIKTPVGDAQAANDAWVKSVEDMNAWRYQKEA
jgi:hypothetical protein